MSKKDSNLEKLVEGFRCRYAETLLIDRLSNLLPKDFIDKLVLDVKEEISSELYDDMEFVTHKP